MEGVQEATQILEDAIAQEKINPTARSKTKNRKKKTKSKKPVSSPAPAAVITIAPTISPTISSPEMVSHLGSVTQLQLMNAQYMMQMQMFGYLMNPQSFFSAGGPNPFRNPDPK